MSDVLAAPRRMRRRSRFFQGIAIFVLICVMMGFTPTFFLFLRPLFRPLFYAPTIPWYYFLHGALMTAWIALFLVQTSLVAGQRMDLHRRLGIGGAVLAVAVTISMMVVTLGLPQQFKIHPVRNGGQLMSFQAMAQLTWTNLVELILFPVVIAADVPAFLHGQHRSEPVKNRHPDRGTGRGRANDVP